MVCCDGLCDWQACFGEGAVTWRKKARRETILAALARAEQEADDPWGTWGIRSYSQFSGSHMDFSKTTLAKEAQDRIDVLRKLLEEQ